MRTSVVLNKLAMAMVVISLIVLFMQMYNRAGNNDFTSYLLSSQALLYGTNPYDTTSPFPYLYPPTFAFLLIPFSVVPTIVLQIVWFWINVFLLIYLIRFLIFDLSSVYQHHTGLFYFVFISVLFNIIQNNLLNAQVNILILFFCFLFWKLYREGNKTWGSFILALAISIKIVPAFLILYLIFRKDYKQIMFSIGFVILFLILPIMVTGLKLFEIYNNYFHILYSKSNITDQNIAQREMFFSITAAFRYFVPQLGHLISNVFSILIIVLLYIVFEIFLKRKATRNDTNAVLGIYLVGIILLSPISETHHLIFLLPIFLIIFTDLWHNYKEKNVFDYSLYLITIVALFFAKNINQPMYFFMIISLIVLFLKNIVFNKKYLLKCKV